MGTLKHLDCEVAQAATTDEQKQAVRALDFLTRKAYLLEYPEEVLLRSIAGKPSPKIADPGTPGLSAMAGKLLAKQRPLLEVLFKRAEHVKQRIDKDLY